MTHGVLNLVKPPGMTSHDAVAFVRRVLKNKRVGHTGTLDPAAAGVLPICVGQATRLVEYLQAGTKEYIAEMTFGHETDTLDAVGQIIRHAPTTQINLEILRAALDGFRGEITQTPPLYSAIKKDGQKLYEIARAGGEIEIPTRQVTISKLVATRFIEGEKPRAIIHIECSGGTYIRSLVRDIGIALGSAATMTFLVRNRNGVFGLHEAVSCEEFEANPTLVPFEEALNWCARNTVESDEAALTLFQGKLIKAPQINRLEGYKEDSDAWKQLYTRRAQIDSPKNSVMIHNAAKTLFALAIPSRETGFYRAEKVFDLREK
ncbi:tRNA pseudouridine55 synthase [Abditibacterium utsteinense]|uniref:tRNA pseudouridine synthase B n=1 Tax=Abditibacterium utsteinense TaxID=1960156 RepID=A0A2S8STD0_9BACT|nr:tRNA pseudouridine(55) synthase TruB [Abditibacterium utsteinense]PQV64038.1 tRNA pseudouridine55 synthase [Abditibacterium utsteinense]